MLLFLLLLVHLATASSMYHGTDFIMKKFTLYCELIPELSCQWHDDILVVDYLPEKPMDQLWVFGEHARERITSEIAFRVINDIINMKPSHRITIIPVLNVWGRKQVDRGDTCLRKNENGVDTNRNYQVDNTHSYPRGSEEYEGPHPLSEKESKLVSTLLLSGVQRYINIHSGEYSMYMPYDSDTSTPPNLNEMTHFLNTLKPLCPQCTEGSAAVVSSYKAFGTSVDYAIKNGVPEAYTFEVFGSTDYSCEKMFNPVNYDEFVDVTNMWKKILMATVIDESLSQTPTI